MTGGGALTDVLNKIHAALDEKLPPVSSANYIALVTEFARASADPFQ